MTTGFEEALSMLDDTPHDCHRHCEHYDTEGTCCDCGDTKTPIHPAPFDQEMILCPTCGMGIDSELLDSSGVAQCSRCGARLVRDEMQSLTYVDEIPYEEHLGG